MNADDAMAGGSAGPPAGRVAGPDRVAGPGRVAGPDDSASPSADVGGRAGGPLVPATGAGAVPAADGAGSADAASGADDAAGSADEAAGSDDAAGSAESPAAAGPARPDAPRPPQVMLLALVAGFVLLIDAVSKALIVANMADGESIRLLGGLVYFSLIRNPGAAFSMATGMTWILAIVAIGVVVLIIRMAPRLRSPIWAVCLGLILGGALGNLMDRIFRSPGVLRGHVVDFISVFGPDAKYFPVFNLADSAITIGGVLLVLVTLIGIDFDGHRVRRSSSGGPPRDGRRARAGSGSA